MRKKQKEIEKESRELNKTKNLREKMQNPKKNVNHIKDKLIYKN